MSFADGIITACKNALEINGYTVFLNVLGYHTGRRTKSRTYVELERSITQNVTEDTWETASGTFSLGARLHKGYLKVPNDNASQSAFSAVVKGVEKSLAQVKIGGMYTRLNISREESSVNGLRGIVQDFNLFGNISICQDRNSCSFGGVPPYLVQGSEQFETLAQNLKSKTYTVTYADLNISTIVYDMGQGESITKTLVYDIDNNVTSVALSGDVPYGIATTKTLHYIDGNLSSVEYS